MASYYRLDVLIGFVISRFSLGNGLDARLQARSDPDVPYQWILTSVGAKHAKENLG